MTEAEERANLSSCERPPYAVIFSVFGFLVLVTFLAWYAEQPPAPLPADALAAEFSAERAIEHIRVIAQEPHAAGTPENDEVRDYIFEQLQAMGVEAEIQSEVVVRQGWTSGGVALAQNVIGRIPGTANTKSFAMEAHYDSVPYGPGATDDCAGVAAMLEAARALKAGPPLMNDVVFVFSDGEECGLLGARAFVRHPLAAKTGVILNFEARGTSGPSYMFETSDENGWLIAQLAKAGVPVRATSVMSGVYKASPFGSDFTVLRRAGLHGFNVAFVESFAYYHNREDKPENVSLASLQHHGEYALGLARHFGDVPLHEVTAPDATYFNVLGGWLVHYPLSWTVPLAGLAGAMLAGVTILGLLRKRLTIRGILAGFLVSLLCACIAAMIGAALTLLVWCLHGQSLLYNNGLYGVGFICIGIGVVAAFWAFFRRFVRVENLVMGVYVWWFSALLLAVWFLPGGAYLFTWPLLFSAAGLAIAFLLPESGGRVPRGTAALTVLAAPALLLIVPGLEALLAMTTLLGSAVLMIFVVFLMGLVIPQLVLMTARKKWWLPGTTVLTGVVVVAVALATNGPSPSRPRTNCLSYGLDLDSGRAYWMSSDDAVDEWTAQFFPAGTPREPITEFIPREKLEHLKTPAPVADLAGPELHVTADSFQDGVRKLAFRVTSPRKAPRVHLYVESESDVVESGILGKDMRRGWRGKWSKRIYFIPDNGADVTLRLEGPSPVTVRVVEWSYDLSGLPGMPSRPARLMTETNVILDRSRNLLSNHVFVARTFELPSAG